MGLGGNTPRTPEALSRARTFLARALEDTACSSLYRTAPQGDTEQAPFWNAAVAGSWSGSAESLLERMLMVEAGEGRVRDPLRPKGPRVLDLDLLLFGDLERTASRLSLPHPRLAFRRFALEPLVEVLVALGERSRADRWEQVLRGLPDQGVDRTGLPW